MSVNSYLMSLSSNLNLSDNEKAKIKVSLETLSNRLTAYFGNDLKDHFVFGSYTRGTILPRKADNYSDIDYMIIFHNEENYKPETFLRRLRQFVKSYYTTSEIYQSHPTIVLNLNHIKFELVPAKQELWGSTYIPSPSSSYIDWLQTDPKSFDRDLTSANLNHNYNIKPLIRLIKYWNRINGNHLTSYELERRIANAYYPNRENLKSYVYQNFDNLTYNYSDPQIYKEKVDRAKRIINKTRTYENDGLKVLAEHEIQKLFPKF